MKLMLTAAILLFLFASVTCAMDFSNMSKYVTIYNGKIEQAPPIMRSIVGNEKVDFTITLNNSGSVRWGMELENAIIVRSAYGGLQNPTIAVNATEDAIIRILDASDPIDAYKQAETSGEIRLDCRTLTSKFKVATALSAGGAIKPFLGLLRSG